MMTPFEWVVGDSSKDHTVTALTSVTTSPVTERYTTMRDLTTLPGQDCEDGLLVWVIGQRGQRFTSGQRDLLKRNAEAGQLPTLPRDLVDRVRYVCHA